VSRGLIILLTAMVCLAGSVAVGLYGVELIAPSLPSPLVAILQDPAARWIAMASAGAVAFFVLAFLVPALVDGIRLGALAATAHRLTQGQQAGGPATPHDLGSAFYGTPLAHRAKSHAAGLWNGTSLGGASERAPDWWATVPAEQSFAPEILTRREEAALFARLGPVLWGIGIIALATALGTFGAPALENRIFVQLVLFDLLAGGIVLLLAGAIGLIQAGLIRRIAIAVDALFPAVTGNTVLSAVRELLRRDGEARDKALGTLGEKLSADIAVAAGELRSVSATHDRRLSSSIAGAVQRATEPVAKGLVDFAEKLDTDGAALSQRLLEGVLAQFAAQLEKTIGAELAEAAALLGSTNEVAAQLRETLGAMRAESLAVQERHDAALVDGLRQSLDDALARLGGELERAEGQLREGADTLGAGLDRVTTATEAALQRWSERFDEIANGILRSGGEELKRTAASFGQLHSILETLTVAVLPSINRLAETHDRLHSRLGNDRERDEALNGIAQILHDASRLARETVERQILLTKELTRVAPALGDGRAAPPPAPAPTEPAPTLSPERVSALVRALGDLRSEADDSAKTLPQL
jgi:hypothetical protein